MREGMTKLLSFIMIIALIVTLVPEVEGTVKVAAAEEGFDIGLVNFDATLSGEGMEKENLTKMKKYIKEAYREGDEILVFPEYALTSTKKAAIDVDKNKSVTIISALAETYEMYILFGSMIQENGKYYSATVICSPDGTVDTYEKTHLTDEEYAEGLSVGDEPIPKQYRYTEHIIYQIGSAFMIISMLFSYLFVNKRLNFDWIKDRNTLPDNLIIKYYVLAEKGYYDKKSLSCIEQLSYKKAKKTLEKEIKKVFPDWIREVAINLQNDTVQSSIENTYKNLPFVLKRPVRKLLVDFEKYPVGIEPYDNFLKELDLQDIKSSIKMFYSMNELGKEQSDNQLESIIDRNNKMAGRAEEMKNKDKIGAAGMLTALPMLVGVIKIIVDMILMIIVFTSSISNVVNGG
ncbi:carbon-nitrogen hydrolase family protein [uncultured Eubacterium sp.]|uniref:carbon-nitrogen hydrolase family protein n=1 Tax=uncultured Eubacterium sp. TaxID=165185 RepID=UPI0026728B23|nr:carbon-nitrogen hydrolase family protein [uncultured Eubacterium sp.]